MTALKASKLMTVLYSAIHNWSHSVGFHPLLLGSKFTQELKEEYDAIHALGEEEERC